FPYLTGLIQKIRPHLDRRVQTMGVFASGRLAINREFAESLSAQDMMFVLTHELYHLALRTHERGEGTDPHAFNCAHDYIINDMLREELQVSQIPAGGLDWPGARHMSAEKILGDLLRDGYCPARVWQQGGDRGWSSGGWDDDPHIGSHMPPKPGQGGDVLDDE